MYPLCEWCLCKQLTININWKSIFYSLINKHAQQNVYILETNVLSTDREKYFTFLCIVNDEKINWKKQTKMKNKLEETVSVSLYCKFMEFVDIPRLWYRAIYTAAIPMCFLNTELKYVAPLYRNHLTKYESGKMNHCQLFPV